MKKIHLNQLLRNRAQFNGVGQLMNATHAIQRALGMEPVAMPMASPMPTPASAPTAAPMPPTSTRWRGSKSEQFTLVGTWFRKRRTARSSQQAARPVRRS